MAFKQMMADKGKNQKEQENFVARYGEQIAKLDNIEKEWQEIKNSSPSIEEKATRSKPVSELTSPEQI